MCVWGQINPGPSSLLVEQLMALVTRRADVFKSCAALDDRAVRTPSTLQHTSLLDTFVASRRMNFSFSSCQTPRLPLSVAIALVNGRIYFNFNLFSKNFHKATPPFPIICMCYIWSDGEEVSFFNKKTETRVATYVDWLSERRRRPRCTASTTRCLATAA